MLEKDGSDELESDVPDCGAAEASFGGERGRGVFWAKVTEVIELTGMTGWTVDAGRSPASPIRSSLSIRLASTVSFSLPRRSAMLLTFSGDVVMVVRAKGRQSTTLCRRGTRGVRSNGGAARSGAMCDTKASVSAGTHTHTQGRKVHGCAAASARRVSCRGLDESGALASECSNLHVHLTSTYSNKTQEGRNQTRGVNKNLPPSPTLCRGT